MVQVVQHLLSNSGRPPRVVCLDWAWQLRAFQQKELATPENVSSVTTKDQERQLTWNEVTVGENGKLCLEPNHRAVPAEIDPLLRELLYWSERADDPSEEQAASIEVTVAKAGPFSDLSDVDEYLRHATLAMVTRSAETRTSADRQTPTLAEEHSLRNAQTLRSMPGSSNYRPNHSLRSGTRREFRSSTSHLRTPSRKAIGRALIVVLVTMGAWAVWSRQTGGDRQKLTSKTQRSRDVAASSELVQSTQPVELLYSSNLVNGSLAPGTENEMPQADDLLHGLANLPSVDARTLDSLQPALDDAAISPISDAMNLESGVLRPTTAAPDQMGNEPDLMATLEAVTREAESAQSETEIATNGNSPPFLIPTIPMLQLQKLPASYQVRAKKPAWSLRIQTSEGFRVDPQSAQLISAREVASWIIREEQEQEFQTLILVQAQLAGARSTSIKWRIVAGAQDLPQFALPLGPKYLDAMQFSLSQFTSRLQFQIDGLQALAASDGLASGLRSSISAQRREFQSQLKIAARVLEIVADANQMEGWLDGQLEVHAQFLDLASPDSPALLQLGEFASQPADVPATNEPQVVP